MIYKTCILFSFYYCSLCSKGLRIFCCKPDMD